MDQTLAFLIVVIVGLVLVFIVVNNGIIRRKNMVVRSWSDVITYERQKNETLPELEKYASEFREHEKGLLTEVTALRNALNAASSSDVNTDRLAEIQQRSQSLLGSFQVAVEAYPDVKAASITNNLMKEFSELQDNVAAAITIFNSNVEAFNSGIQVFPNSMVNSYGAKETPYKPFTNAEAVESVGFTLEQE